jgi:hypothetical protein
MKDPCVERQLKKKTIVYHVYIRPMVMLVKQQVPSILHFESIIQY